MAPSNWVSLLFLIYFLVPGFYLDVLTKRHKEIYEQSPLSEFGRIVLGSMAFTTFGFILVAISRVFFPNLTFSPRSLFLEKDYFSQNFDKTLWTLLAQQLITLMAVWIYDTTIIAKAGSYFTSSHHWNLLFLDTPAQSVDNSNNWLRKQITKIVKKNEDNKKEKSKDKNGLKDAIEPKSETYRVARVTLMSHEEIVGFMQFWSLEENMADREIILSPVHPHFLELLPENIRGMANSDNLSLYKYIPIHSIEKITIYEVEFPLD